VTVSVRPLNGAEEWLLVAARLVGIEHAPYLAHALFTVRPLAAEGLGTCAVDRGWRLYLDPATLAGCALRRIRTVGSRGRSSSAAQLRQPIYSVSQRQRSATCTPTSAAALSRGRYGLAGKIVTAYVRAHSVDGQLGRYLAVYASGLHT